MNELLTIEDIARIWHCSVRHARDVLVKARGFPPPAPGSGRKLRVWHAEAVNAYARGQASNDADRRAA